MVMRPLLAAVVTLLICVANGNRQGKKALVTQKFIDAGSMLEGGLFDQAIAAYEEVIALNREEFSALDAESYFMMSHALRAQDRLDEAVECLEHATTIEPLHPLAHAVLGNTYSMQNRNDAAVSSLQEAAQLDPNNEEFHFQLGQLLEKMGRHEDAIDHYYQSVRIIAEKQVPSHQLMRAKAKFYVWGMYLHTLGSALKKMDKHEEALQVFNQGVAIGLWKDPLLRFVSPRDHEVSEQQPWFDHKDDSLYPSSLVSILEQNFAVIREEALSLTSTFVLEPEALHDKGEWDLFRFAENGKWREDNGKVAPKTFEVLQGIPELAGCMATKTCDAFFSRMKPGTHVAPHCGPTNLRMRVHLALVVPDGCALRVGNETRQWEEGHVLVFDDAFEHEVWHNGTTERIVLILDIWHPAAPTSAKSPPKQLKAIRIGKRNKKE